MEPARSSSEAANVGAATRPSGIAIPVSLPAPIARWRKRWDLAASLGARPHVTVLYPFLPEAALTASVRQVLAALARRYEPFDLSFHTLRRFDGVLWMDAGPVPLLRQMTAAVTDRWPGHPPYAGLFDAVLPHCTVVESDAAPLGEIEAHVLAALPFDCRADRLEVWYQDAEGRWRPRWRLPLGVRSSAARGAHPRPHAGDR